MTQGTIDDKYFEWLYSQIAAVRNRNPSRAYWRLAKRLYTTEFLWTVPNDDNRIEDGIELRDEFLSTGSGGYPIDDSWLALQCSVLEMLIALSRRAAFESRGSSGEWFWHFMQNLNLKGYTDKVYSFVIDKEIDAVVTRLVDRTYDHDGTGGLFPLRNPRRDQRDVELWHQLSAYVLEGDYIDYGPFG